MKVRSWSHRNRVIAIERHVFGFDSYGITDIGNKAELWPILQKYLDDVMIVEEVPLSPPKPVAIPVVKAEIPVIVESVKPIEEVKEVLGSAMELRKLSIEAKEEVWVAPPVLDTPPVLVSSAPSLLALEPTKLESVVLDISESFVKEDSSFTAGPEVAASIDAVESVEVGPEHILFADREKRATGPETIENVEKVSIMAPATKSRKKQAT